MPRKSGETEPAKQEVLEAAAEERAVIRASIATSAVQLRLLTSLVPVMSCLDLVEVIMGALNDPNIFRKEDAEMMTGLFEHMEAMAREAAAQVSREAEALNFPLAEEVERFRKLGARLGTLSQMRQELASLDAPDWDQWLDDLQEQSNDDE